MFHGSTEDLLANAFGPCHVIKLTRRCFTLYFVEESLKSGRVVGVDATCLMLFNSILLEWVSSCAGIVLCEDFNVFISDD